MPGKIYILSPGNILSGGVSSLHNLCIALVQNNYHASVFYIDVNEEFIKTVLLSKFNNPRADKIEDSQENLLIVPETLINYFKNYPDIRKLVYWLSLKFFLKDNKSYKGIMQNYFLRKLFYPRDYIGQPSSLIDGYKQKIIQRGVGHSAVWNKEIIHLTNSFYTYMFCLKMGAIQAKLLYNPLSDQIFQLTGKHPRKNQILIGARSSKSLQYYLKWTLPKYKVIRLKRMTLDQVYEYMSESIAFIDLSTSNRDRSHREAAFLGCIVFASCIGSARFMEDVPIPLKYKFKESIFIFPKLKKQLLESISNYDHSIKEFDAINEHSRSDKKNFLKRVKEIFQKI